MPNVCKGGQISIDRGKKKKENYKNRYSSNIYQNSFGVKGRHQIEVLASVVRKRRHKVPVLIQSPVLYLQTSIIFAWSVPKSKLLCLYSRRKCNLSFSAFLIYSVLHLFNQKQFKEDQSYQPHSEQVRRLTREFLNLP